LFAAIRLQAASSARSNSEDLICAALVSAVSGILDQKYLEEGDDGGAGG
jgi:hypothetical protein